MHEYVELRTSIFNKKDIKDINLETEEYLREA